MKHRATYERARPLGDLCRVPFDGVGTRSDGENVAPFR